MADNELMQPEPNVQRIMATGSLWFLGAIGSIAIFGGLLVANGWRPAVLPAGLAVLFWIAATGQVLSVGLIGWSGCPILEVDVATANRNKTRTMQLGTLLFIISGAAVLLAVLAGPA